MPEKLRTAAAVTGGILAAMALPAHSALAAQAAPAGSHPGLKDAQANPATHGSTAGSKAAAAPAATAATCGASGTITWQDRYDSRYLEVYHSGTANGDYVDAYPGNGTCTQHWYAIASGSWSNGGGQLFGLYGMVNANSFLCLEAPSTNIGNAHVVQESCGFSSYNYLWAELSGPSGWVLDEDLETSTPLYDNGGGVVACEDVSNHWIYTSHPNNVIKGTNTPKNCIWH